MINTRAEIRRHFVAGDYHGAVAASDGALLALAKIKGEGSRRLYRQILNDKARSLRNLGKIEAALQCYVTALNDAHDEGDYLEEGWQLALFGKLFGKYLQRHALFFACLRETDHRFSAALNSTTPPESGFILRYAIVQDLLGSFFRRLADRDLEMRRRCEEAHLRSISLHQQIGNSEGIARATCHLGYARAMFATFAFSDSVALDKALRDSLALFESGLHYVLRSPEALRGRATRRAQQSEIYLLLREYRTAERFARESIFFARTADDPRALIIGQRALGRVFLETNRPVNAVHELEEALDVATDRRFIGFVRQLTVDLVPVYLLLDDPDRSAELLRKLDALTIRELDELKGGFSGAIETFRRVAPQRADRYLVEGQNHDNQTQTRELIELHSILPGLISQHQRRKASRQQAQILRFARHSIRHALRNSLNEMVMTVDSLKRRRNPRLIANLDRVVSNILADLDATAQVDPVSESASFVSEMRGLLEDFFPGRYAINLRHEIVFPHLHPEVLREVLLHFVENAVAAIAANPPASAHVNFFELTEDQEAGHLVFFLKNPGANPTENSMPVLGVHPPFHGFQNAYWFFTEVLGFDCSFAVVEEGPATEALRSNCVTIRIPMRSAHASIIVT